MPLRPDVSTEIASPYMLTSRNVRNKVGQNVKIAIRHNCFHTDRTTSLVLTEIVPGKHDTSAIRHRHVVPIRHNDSNL